MAQNNKLPFPLKILQELKNLKQEQTKQDTDIENLDLNKASKAELQEATLALQVELLATRKDLEASSLEGQAEGESLYLQDSSNARFREFGIGGNDKQEKREGYNLYNVKNELEFANGISVDEEDWITCSYDNTDGEKTKFLNFYTKNLDIETNTNYAIIIEVKNVAGTGTLFAVSHEADGQFLGDPTYDFTNLSNNSIKKTIQKTKETFESNVRRGLRTYLRFAKGESGSITFRISVLKDTSITENSFKYEQYGAMPSLEFPSETEAVGQDVNLLDISGTSQTINGVQFTVNEDKTVTANGTATANASFYVFAGEAISSREELPTKNTSYTLSGCPEKGDISKYRMGIVYSKSGNDYTVIADYGNGAIIDYTSEKIGIFCEIRKGYTANNIVFKPKLTKGNKITSYSSYGCGSANVAVCNKNIFNKNAETIKGTYSGNLKIDNDSMTFESTEFKWNTVNRIAWLIELPDLEKDIYISTKSIIRPYTNNAGLFYKFVEDKNVTLPTGAISDIVNISASANGKQVGVTPTSKYLMILLQAQYVDASASTGLPENRTVSVNKLMVSYSNNTDYAEHEEQTFTIDVQQEMLEGDYFDLDNEEEVHTWGKYEITGNEADLQGIGWFKSNVSRTDAYGITNERIGLPVLTENTSKCTHAKYTNNVNAVNTTKYVSLNEKFYLCFPLGVAETLEEFKTLMQEQVDNGTPVTIYYKLAEPTKIPFNSEQRAVAKQIRETVHSYKDGTHVYSTDSISPIFNTRYTKDLNAVISNISQNIVGGN